MKIALLNDTHFGARNDSNIFDEYFYKFYNDIFFPYLKENNIKTLIHLGDIVDRRKYINYTFRDDMISDGIENCLQYMDNFNPDKSNNPFAYFTQIIYYAFIRRIQKEKKQIQIKSKLIQNTGVENMMDQLQGDDAQYQSQLLDFLQKNVKIDEPTKK